MRTPAKLAIVEATQELLDEVAFEHLTVGLIAERAGVSRQAFYLHFATKDEVVAVLVRQVVDELQRAIELFVQGIEGARGEDVVREGVEAATLVWSEYGSSLRVLIENWHVVTELRALWLGLLDGLIARVAAGIEHECAAGCADAATDSRALASALVWGTTRCLQIAGLGVDDVLPGERQTTRALTAMWLGAIYSVSARTG
jgi:AcrR family transcriptional regulator